MAQHITDTPVIESDTLSMAAVTLDEVTVMAPKVIHKPDMDILLPSRKAVDASPNSLSLLSHLMIPTLNVNEFMGTVTTGGQEVEIRINGRRASAEELTSVRPASVKRIEWIDNPGLRYGDAVAVINVVTVNPTAGGSMSAEGMQALNQPWSRGNMDLKLNYGRSQWSLSAWGAYTNRISSYREYSETFTDPAGNSVTRTETPVDGFLTMTKLGPQLSYSYMNSDKTVLWIGVGVNKDWPVEQSNTGIMSSTASTANVLLHESEATSGIGPKISAYLEQRLSRSQTIAFNVSTSAFSGHSSRDYIESDTENGDRLTDIHTDIHDRRHSLSIEGDYVKKWADSRLTAGISYSASRNRATRESGAVSRRNSDRTYLFAEYFRRIGRVNLTGGIGAQYDDQRTVGDGGKTSLSLRPRLSANYRLNPSSQFRIGFTTRRSSPSYNQTNPVPQQIDGFRYQVGNPMLHTYSVYRTSFQYNFTLPRVSGKFEATWTRSPHEIAPYMTWEGDRLYTYFENSHGRSNYEFILSPQIEIVPGAVTLGGSVRYIHTVTAGCNYRHSLSRWCGDVSLMAYYGNFNLLVSYEKNPVRLVGETITMGEEVSMAGIGYRLKNLMIYAGIFMPFTKYSMGSESLSRYNSNHNILRSNSFDKMPVIRLSYSFNWGKQRKSASRIINDDDSDDGAVQTKAAGR